MSLIYLLLLLLFKCYNCFDIPPEPIHDMTLSNCVLLATEKYLHGEQIFFIPSITEVQKHNKSSVKNTYILKSLENDLKWSVALRIFNENIVTFDHYTREFSGYIIFFNHPSEIEIIFNKLEKSMSWNPKAKFLITSRNYFKNNSELAKNMFNLLSSYNVINTVIMLTNLENFQDFSFFTWNPFEGGNCGNVVKTVLTVGACTQWRLETNTSWYRTENYRLFKNCNLIVGTLNLGTHSFHMKDPASYPEFRFLEMRIVDIIAEFSNISTSHVELIINTPGDVLNNGIVTGGFQYLRNNTIDILLGGYSLTTLRYIYFDTSNPYIQDTLTWCVPNYPVFTKFQEMFNIVRPTAWILIFSVYFVVAILIRWIGTHNEEEYVTYRSISNIFLYEFTIALAMSLNKLPRTMQMRYLVMIFVIFCFYIVIGYQTYLASILADDSNVQKYASQKDIYKYNLKTYFRYNSKRYFSDEKLILERYMDCIWFGECMHHVAIDRDSAIFVSRRRIKYNFNDYVSRTEGALIHCFKDTVVNYPQSFYMRKGSPFHTHTNKAIGILTATGILQRMVNDYMTPKKNEIDGLGITDSQPLKFENLMPVFILLVAGNFVAFCVFLLELTIPKVFARSKR